MKQKILVIGIVLFICLIIGLSIVNNNQNTNDNFNSYVLNTIMLADDGGGYYTGRAEKE